MLYIFKDISAGVDRIVHIVNGLNLFANADKEEKSKVNLHDIINMAFDTVRNKNTEIAITKDFDSSIGLIECFQAQLINVFRNIFTNSFEATEGEGNIYVFTKKMKDHILIEINDDGEGMKEEHVQKAIEPFFTTKENSKNTGLGLSIVHGIIGKHTGKIEIESQKNEGTIVRIRLPFSI